MQWTGWRCGNLQSCCIWYTCWSVGIGPGNKQRYRCLTPCKQGQDVTRWRYFTLVSFTLPVVPPYLSSGLVTLFHNYHPIHCYYKEQCSELQRGSIQRTTDRWQDRQLDIHFPKTMNIRWTCFMDFNCTASVCTCRQMASNIKDGVLWVHKQPLQETFLPTSRNVSVCWVTQYS